MPNTKSAAKQARVSVRRHLRNQSIRSAVKTNITRAEKLIFAGELEEARKVVAVAVTSLDEAAEKGMLHANNAARRKSRLMHKLNQAQQVAVKKAEPEKKE